METPCGGIRWIGNHKEMVKCGSAETQNHRQRNVMQDNKG